MPNGWCGGSGWVGGQWWASLGLDLILISALIGIVLHDVKLQRLVGSNPVSSFNLQHLVGSTPCQAFFSVPL
jgi:hypothetical protein